MKKNLVTSAGAILVIGLLAGCGSGGGGSTPTSNPSGSPASFAGATSTGAVVDGIIKQGKIVANELDASGNPLRQVGSATTDDSGKYSITLDSSYAGGPIDFVLTGDANTTMVCDVAGGCGQRNDTIQDPNSNSTVDFGEDMNVNGLTMDAIIANANAGDTLSVNITPFTTAAAKRARAAASLDATAVNNANSAISNLLGGLDIVSLQPVDLTDSAALAATGVTKAQITYAVLASAIGKIAFDASGNADTDSLTTALNKLANSVTGDNISANGNGTPLSLQAIVTATMNQFQNMGLNDQTGVLTQLQNQINTATAAAGNGLVAVMANANAGSSDIAKAKALIQEIRTWGVSLAQPGPAADAFGAHLNSAGAVTTPLMNQLGNSLVTALDIIAFNYQSVSILPPSIPYNYSGVGSGMITISQDTPNTTVTLNGTIYNETVNDLSITFTTPTNSLHGMDANISGNIYTTDSSAGGVSLTINNDSTAEVTFDGLYDLTNVLNDVGPGSAHITSAGFKLDATLAQTGVTNPVSFTGSIQLNDAKPFGSKPNVRFIPSSAKLMGTLADNANSAEATINVSATIPDTFDPAQKDADNAIQGTASVAVTVKLDGLPQAQLTATANKTGSDRYTGDASAILAQDGETITIDGSRDSSGGQTSTLTFTDTANASLTLAYSSLDINKFGSGTLKVGSNSVGTLTKLDNGIIKVSYMDGTFETLQ